MRVQSSICSSRESEAPSIYEGVDADGLQTRYDVLVDNGVNWTKVKLRRNRVVSRKTNVIVHKCLQNEENSLHAWNTGKAFCELSHGSL